MVWACQNVDESQRYFETEKSTYCIIHYYKDQGQVQVMGEMRVDADRKVTW